ncbi:hypothetical protein E2I00_006589, partial [Balaenoptera physalus]
MIHILDTEHPWDVHSIRSEHSEAVTCLEWDHWESPVGSLVEGDPIVALSWLHNGVKLALHVEKSGASSFGEKFSRVKFSPSLTLFGGKPMEGWIAVTVSGLVTVSLLKPSGQVLTSTESLCRLRGRVALADIAFTGGGNIVVATADGSSASPVQFYKVCVSVVNEKCRIDTEILPSLFMRCTTDLNRRDRLPAITHLKFLARDMSEQGSWGAGRWLGAQAHLSVTLESRAGFGRLTLHVPPGLALAFHDGSVHIVHRLSLQTMAIFYSSAAPRSVLSTRILAMKASLCKLSPCAVTRSPGDRLTEICAKITDVDIDKVMINLKTEEFVLDMNTLQALQQLLQWGSPLRPGHSFLRDGTSLGMLRELMVVIRIWGLLKPSCLPVYTATSDTQDSMSLLFRLLTKLWICCKTPSSLLSCDSVARLYRCHIRRDEGPTSEPDEALVDECCLLPSQLLIPSLDWLPVSDGLVSRLQPKQPLRLHFGKPPALPGSATSLQLDGLIRAPGQPKMDHLRRLHLGAYPTEACKACTRCGCVTMLKSPNKTTAVKQWEQRWIKNCLRKGGQAGRAPRGGQHAA